MNKTVKLDIPKDLGGWREAIDRAKDIYWQARRDGCDENAALTQAVDDALRDGVARR